MRIVLLTGTKVEHRYVARTLADTLDGGLAAVVIARPRPVLSRLRSYLRRHGVRQIAARVAARSFRRIVDSPRYRDEVHEAVYGPQWGEWGAAGGRLRAVSSHNAADCVQLLEELRPDVLAVYGTALIREHVSRRARCSALNLHTGVAPRYRGADSVFWALHNREPEWIGATVHGLVAAVDGGPVFEVVRPRLEPTDTEYSLFCKCVAVGAHAYARVIEQMHDGGTQGEFQSRGEGREYRSIERTLGAELRVRAHLRAGLLSTGRCS